jgi:hypothetical protein
MMRCAAAAGLIPLLFNDCDLPWRITIFMIVMRRVMQVLRRVILNNGKLHHWQLIAFLAGPMQAG